MAEKTALIVVDMINAYDHPDAEKLVPSVERNVEQMGRLVARAGEEGATVIYVNDNFGEWSSSRDSLLEKALAGEYGHLVRPIKPPPDVPFVHKARHSIFYQTPLEYLLRQEGIGRLVLIGQVTEQCILYSALDAHIRHFDVVVPRDAVAHIHESLAEASYSMMERNMSVDVCDADEVSFS